MNPLERRYRRLLYWYPSDHRQTYGEEMIGVLMASAADGQTHPGLAEVVDLARSGLLARLRNVGTGTDGRWRDALALYSLAAPVLVTAALVRTPWFMGMLLWGGPPRDGQVDLRGVLYHPVYSEHAFPLIAIAMHVLTLTSPMIPALLAVLRLRRTAIVVAGLLLAWLTTQASLGWQIQAPNTVALLAMLGVELAALIASDGPRRGVRLITWRGIVLAVPWLAGGVVADLGARGSGVHVAKAAIVLAILAALATLASARARRVLLLFAIPVAPFVVVVPPYQSSDVMYWTPAVLGVVAFVVSRRSLHERLARHSDAAGGIA